MVLSYICTECLVNYLKGLVFLKEAGRSFELRCYGN